MCARNSPLLEDSDSDRIGELVVVSFVLSFSFLSPTRRLERCVILLALD